MKYHFLATRSSGNDSLRLMGRCQPLSTGSSCGCRRQSWDAVTLVSSQWVYAAITIHITAQVRAVRPQANGSIWTYER
jgi:hypothetical protein